MKTILKKWHFQQRDNTRRVNSYSTDTKCVMWAASNKVTSAMLPLLLLLWCPYTLWTVKRTDRNSWYTHTNRVGRGCVQQALVGNVVPKGSKQPLLVCQDFFLWHPVTHPEVRLCRKLLWSSLGAGAGPAWTVNRQIRFYATCLTAAAPSGL